MPDDWTEDAAANAALAHRYAEQAVVGLPDDRRIVTLALAIQSLSVAVLDLVSHARGEPEVQIESVHRCTATTAAGVRCKRNARPGEVLCTHHFKIELEEE